MAHSYVGGPLWAKFQIFFAIASSESEAHISKLSKFGIPSDVHLEINIPVLVQYDDTSTRTSTTGD